MGKFSVALLFGGPSQERGISLNSARSVLDHLASDSIEIVPIYIDTHCQAHLIDSKQLYSNTPEDFDFKITELGTALDEELLIRTLKKADITYPVIHGNYGEGGELTGFLEKNDIPFIGSPSDVVKTVFDKYDAAWELERLGFTSLPALLLENPSEENDLGRIESFFQNNQLQKAIVKPTRSGSSIGVTLAHSAEEALAAAQQLYQDKVDTRFVIEPFAKGKEFTVIVLENVDEEPVALLPTEIEITDPEQSLFDYRLKYLPTRQVAYHMPPRFDEVTVTAIRHQAESLFSKLGLRDVVRIDGWVMDDGRIWFSDFNLASGLEQNSFFFLQSAYLGWGHSELLNYILHVACKRRGITPPNLTRISETDDKLPVRVLFGGDSSERQVSLMSGTNVWLKLRKSQKYSPSPYLLDTDGFYWKLPYAATLRHTVEEVGAACNQMLEEMERLHNYQESMGGRLCQNTTFSIATLNSPICMSEQDFLQDNTQIFLAVHGGRGENGELQDVFKNADIRFTGSLSASARLCMDKYETGKVLENYGKHGILVAPKKKLDTGTLLRLNQEKLKQLWERITEELKTRSLIIKPLNDGCSSGICKLTSPEDFKRYLDLLEKGAARMPAKYLPHVATPIEMPSTCPRYLLLETFVNSDKLILKNNKIEWKKNSGWVEITVGVLGARGALKALKPSVTVSSAEILSLEEKFQGGTGVNITPPPEPWVKPEAWKRAQINIQFVANTLGMNGFGRIDAFMNCNSGSVLIIEANSIPGLTPSTVIYHQALAEEPALTPTQFLETILEYSN